MSICNKNILITGGAGFIGSHLTDRLCNENNVIVVDDFSRGDYLSHKVQTVKRDLAASNFNCKIFEGIDIVFHLASSVGSYQFYQDNALDVLIKNTQIDHRVFKAVEDYGIKRLFYASSSHVYPKSLQEDFNASPLREEDAYPADPSLSYGWSKLSSEKYLSYCKGKFKYAIARYNGIYGPRQSTDLANGSIIPVLIERAKKNPNIEYTILTEGQEKRAFCYIDDAVEATLKMIEALDANDFIDPLNIGHPKPVTIYELAQIIKNCVNSEIELKIMDNPIVPDILCQYCDCTAAKELINWVAKISLKEGINLILK
mgnify:CR=1 FL=1